MRTILTLIVLVVGSVALLAWKNAKDNAYDFCFTKGVEYAMSLYPPGGEVNAQLREVIERRYAADNCNWWELTPVY